MRRNSPYTRGVSLSSAVWSPSPQARMRAVISGDPAGVTFPFGKEFLPIIVVLPAHFRLPGWRQGMKKTVLFLAVALSASAQESRIIVPRIWDDKALEDWATPIAALGVRPGHFSSAEYYAVPANN